MTDLTDRIRTTPRWRWLAVAAPVAGLVIASLAVQPAATATTVPPRSVTPLPAAGQETTLGLVATDVPIQVGGSTVTATFTGGLKVEAEHNPIDSTDRSMALRVVSFDMQADTAELGKVQLTKSDVETAPAGLVEMARDYPTTLRNTLVVDFTLTADRMPSTPSPGSSVQQPAPAGPITLTTREPAVLLSDSLSQFPPRGDTYQLEKPVELVLSGNPAAVSATIQQFPVNVSAQ
jgi:hypothetical protein